MKEVTSPPIPHTHPILHPCKYQIYAKNVINFCNPPIHLRCLCSPCICSQMEAPPQSLHWLLCRLCLQMEAPPHPYQPHTASGWRIHCGVEVTEMSTNKQHTLSLHLCLWLWTLAVMLADAVAPTVLAYAPHTVVLAFFSRGYQVSYSQVDHFPSSPTGLDCACVCDARQQSLGVDELQSSGCTKERKEVINL